MKQYDDNQYYEQGDAELGTGFTNYERLLLELNYKNYYPNKTTAEMTGNKDYEGLKGDRIRVYEKILNECGLDPEANYDKNTDHEKIDIVSTRSYESLTSSSIIGTLDIDPNSILLIDEVDGTHMKIRKKKLKD